jgi:type IV secretory pathway VirB3-like protein
MRVSRVYKALYAPQLIAGVSPKVIAVTWPIAILACILTDTLWAVLIAYAIHRIARWFYARDPLIATIYGMYTQTADRYQPDARERLTSTFVRPKGFGRGVRC